MIRVLSILLAKIQISKPKNNLPTKEHLAIKELKQNPSINIKKADKGTSTVIMNKEDKIHEGQTQLDVEENYKALSRHTVQLWAQKWRWFFANIFMSAIETEIIRL